MIRILLTVVAAVLTVLAYPPIGWHPLAAVSLIPLMVALRGLTPAKAMSLGLLFGILVFVGTLNWLMMVFGPMAILLFLMLALFPAVFAATFSSLERVIENSRWLIIATGILWTGVEFFRCEWFTLRFPWITPGTGLPPGYLTPWIGVYGMSLLVATSAAALTFKHRRLGLSLLGIVLISSYVPMPPTQGGHLTIAAVQGEGIGFDEYLRLSRETDGPIDAFVWPEYAVGYDIRRKPDQLAAIRNLLIEKGASSLTLGSRTEHEDGSWSNTAVTLGLSDVLGSHDKNRPVHFFDDGEAGKETRSFPTPVGRIATPICFDNDYEGIVRAAASDGAELLLVPSMDAAHWSARQHHQHAEFVRHRAAENRRWIAVASSSGLTQTVAPNGRRVAELPLFEPGVLVSKVDLRSHRTPYNHAGWLIGPSCVVCTLALIVASSILTRRQKARSSGN